MAFKRITENDMLGKGNVGKPDTPGVSTSEMQRIMDELPREVIAPAFNELSGQLEADTASADIGAKAPDGITPDPAPAEKNPAKLQAVLQGIVNKITGHITDQVRHVTLEERTSWNNASSDRHTHDNKSILDGITSSLVGNWNAAFAHISDAVRHITENERTNWNDKYTKSETDKAINERVVEIGSSDMTKAVYDPETRNLPYIPKIDAEALTLGKNVVLSGTPVPIAYAGANRIASITAYGENAQGGTTEAPVALTGVDSVFVGGRNLLRVTNMAGETQNGITFTPEPDGRITVSGTATSDAYYTFADKINSSLFGQTVCLSGGSALARIDINERTPNSVFVRNLLSDWGTSPSGILSKKSDENIIYAVLYVKSGTTINTSFYPMLNLGKSPLPYEPYQGGVTQLPIPRALHEVGDVRDVCRTRVKIACDKRVVVNGTESWTLSQGAFRLSLSDAIGPGYAYPCYSSHYSAARTNSANVSNWPDKSLQIGEAGGAVFIKDSGYTTVEEFKAHLVDNPLIIYYRSSSYNGTNGLDVYQTEYQTGFVELDGTENWHWNSTETWAYVGNLCPNHKTGVAPLCSHYPGSSGTVPGSNQVVIDNADLIIIKDPAWQSIDDAKSYLAAQKSAGTPVQIAYQLATPETYATDPVDFDNAAGPLTVMTGGELEVRMTELIGSRSDVSNNTVAFSEAAQDADIASGETLSVLFGKIKKRFSVLNNLVNAAVYPNLLDNSDFSNAINQRNVSGTISAAGYFIDRWKLISGTVQITENGLVLNGTMSQILENAAGTYVTASASAGAASYDNADKTFTLTATGQTITWAKLEKGSVATPYVPKGYGAELLECMRYYQKSEDDLYAVPYGGKSYIVHEFGVPMRVAPTVTLGYSPESREDQTASMYGFTVKFSGASGLLDSWTASADL